MAKGISSMMKFVIVIIIVIATVAAFIMLANMFSGEFNNIFSMDFISKLFGDWGK